MDTELQNVEQPDFTQERDNIPAMGGGVDASQMIESLLSNSHIPKRLQKNMWVFFGKSTKLSFLNDDDIRTMMLQYELLRLTILESITKSEYNEDLEMELIQIGVEFELNLNRSRGGRLNERELLGSSTTASFREGQLGNPHHEPGFLDKLGRMFGGK